MGLLLISKSTLISSILGISAAPTGQIDLGTGGARSATPAERSVCPAGAAVTRKIDESKVYFRISGKLTKWLIRPAKSRKITCARFACAIGFGCRSGGSRACSYFELHHCMLTFRQPEVLMGVRLRSCFTFCFLPCADGQPNRIQNSPEMV